MKTTPTLLALLFAACARLPPAPSHPFVVPDAGLTPVQVCWLELGGTTVAGGFGSGGVSQAETWEVTSSALLIRHPAGDLLLDTGISPSARAEAEELHGWGRFVFDRTAGRNQLRGLLLQLLGSLGVERPSAILLSHAHADHAGGVGLLPDVPVWVAAPEQALVEAELAHPRGVVMPAQARALHGRTRPIPFEARPYATYDEQWDVFGDGSVVVVPTFGHTPGSVATFITIGPELRLVHVGDLINTHESIDRAVGKSAIMRWLTDVDDVATAAQVAKLVQLHALDPKLWILPAHDRPVYEALFGPQASLPPCIGGG